MKTNTVAVVADYRLSVKAPYPAAFHGFDVIPSRISKEGRAKLLMEYKYAQEHYYFTQG